eukprot:scaffold70211_cov26-Prasinocladus_malaysianus.AAC.1
MYRTRMYPITGRMVMKPRVLVLVPVLVPLKLGWSLENVRYDSDDGYAAFMASTSTVPLNSTYFCRMHVPVLVEARRKEARDVVRFCGTSKCTMELQHLSLHHKSTKHNMLPPKCSRLGAAAFPRKISWRGCRTPQTGASSQPG